ncbi:MAG: site-2 protease family protein [Syntrophomonadaceae bacterium]|nr:site-2 protease family protein [Syntrophomonadaceae bacterium]
MEWLIDTLVWLPAILVGLTFHEFAHGLVAHRLGDSTPARQGRLTLNPLPHIDWLGFLMLMVFKFGWAKPVQVNPYNFQNISQKTGMMLVSLAGPGMNLIIALLSMAALKMLIPYQDAIWAAIIIPLFIPLIYINLILAAFNLLPVPPLDGSKILAGILPDAGANWLYSLEQYGPLILLLLIVTNAVGKILWPLVNFLYGILNLVVAL